MLELAKTIPANCKKTKEETYATEQGVQAPSEHTQKNQGLDSLRALDSVSYFGTVCVGRQLVG